KCERDHQDQEERGVRHEWTAGEIVGQAAEEKGENDPAVENRESNGVRAAVSIEGHAAGEQSGESIHESEDGERACQTDVFADQELDSADRFGEDSQGGAGTNFVRDRGGGADPGGKKTGDEHD